MSQSPTSKKLNALWQTLPALIRCSDVAMTRASGDSPIGRCIVTGLGGSTWPAHVLEWSMRLRNADCEVVPLSRFATDAPVGDTLVIFSQYLSNNTALALVAAQNYRRVLIVSALDERRFCERLSDLGVTLEQFKLVTVATPEERGFLFRPVGPALMATVGVSRLLEAAGLEALPLESIASCYESADSVNAVDHMSNAVLSLGCDSSTAAALAWKANEALGQPVPSWDAIGFAHGGFQATFELPKFEALLLLPGGLPSGLAIERGLRTMLEPRGHTVRAFVSSLGGVAAPFAYDAVFMRYLLARIEASARDLESWPGKGCDAAMYNLTVLDPTSTT